MKKTQNNSGQFKVAQDMTFFFYSNSGNTVKMTVLRKI